MFRNAVAHFPRQIQTASVIFKDVDDAQALLVVIESARHEAVDDTLAGMAERGVAKIVTESNGLGQFLVQAQHFRNRAGNLRNLERVCEPRTVMIAGRREEYLRLVLQPPERLRMDDAIAIALKRRPHIIFSFRAKTASRVGAFGSLR